MAIHTLQLVSKELTFQKHKRCAARIYDLAKQGRIRIVQDKEGLQVFKMRGCPGILTALIEYKVPHLTVTVNPSILLGGTYADLCDITAVNFEYCAATIDEVLAQLKIRLTCDKLILSRIDCTVDIEFPSDTEIMEYILCLKRTKLADAYKLDEFDPANDARNRERNLHSFRASCNDISLTVYDKSYQLADQELMPENEIPPNRLRIEAAFENRSFQRLFYMYHKGTVYDTLKKKIVWFSEMSFQLLEEYFRQTLATGSYLRFDLAVQKILESDFSKKKKDQMILFLHQVVRCHKHGVRRAIQIFKDEDYSASQVRDILHCFQEIGLNPVTIRSDSISERFPCVPDLLMEKGALPASIS